MDAFETIAAGFAQATRFTIDVCPDMRFVLHLGRPTLDSLVCSVLFGAIPIFWYSLNGSPTIVQPGALLWGKITMNILLVIFTALQSIEYVSKTNALTAVVILPCISASCLLHALYLEHRRTLRSSAAIAWWFIFSIAYDVFCIQSPTTLIQFWIILPATIAKIGLLVLNELPKQPLIQDDSLRKKTTLDATKGLLSRTLFFWLVGAKYSIKLEDLKDLDPEFNSSDILAKFNRYWKNAEKTSPHALAKAFFFMMRRELLLLTPSRLACSVFLVSQPLLIRSTMRYAVDTFKVDIDRYLAFGLIGCGLAVYGGSVLSRFSFSKADGRLTTLLRGTITAAVYQKTLSLTPSEADQHTAITLLSGDIDGLLRSVSILHDIWANALEFLVCLGFMIMTIGSGALLVCLPTIASYLLGCFIGGKMPAARAEWNTHTKKRVSTTSHMLSQVKAVKMVGLDSSIRTQLQDLQDSELASLSIYRVWSVALLVTLEFFSMMSSPLMLGVALFGAASTGTISSVDAMVTLSIVEIMSEPLNNVVGSWNQLLSILACMQRIQNYLLLEELHDQRLHTSIKVTKPAEDEALPEEGTINLDLFSNHSEEVEHPPNELFELRNAEITIQGLDHSILTNVSLKLSRGEIAMVVGRTGSGKSTFLRSLTGEAQLTSGHRYKKLADTAYCGQRVWLENKSIRQNILAYSPMDVGWYSAVLEACQLRQDLRGLPHADLTVIGSNGVKLSGGQQHRVALARAVYSRAPIFALDDIFGCLDSRTARSIGLRLLGPGGLLRQLNSTVVLVTHSSQLLRYANRTLLVADGQVNERQGPGDLEFARRLRAILVDSEAREQKSNAGPSNVKVSKDPFEPQAYDTDAIVASNKRKDARRRSDWKLLLHYLGTFNPLTLVLWLISTCLMSFIEMMPIPYVCLWLESQPDDGWSFTGYVVLSAMASVVTAGNLLSWFLGLVPRSVKKTHTVLLETTLDATWAYLSSTDMSSILNLFNQDIVTVLWSLHVDFVKVIYLLANSLIQLGVIVYFAGGYTGAAATGFLVALYIVQLFYGRISREARYLEVKTKQLLSGRFSETVDGLEHIRAFKWEAQAMRSAFKQLDMTQKAFKHAQDVERVLRTVLDTLSMILGVFLIAQAVLLVYNVPTSGAGVSLTTLISLSSNLVIYVQLCISLQTSLGALDRIRHFAQTTPREQGLEDETAVPLPQDWPQNGKVVMRDVTAAYDASSPAVVRSVSTMFPPGRKIGIVGRTGSGKSSLAMTLLKFLDYSGTILIDNVDIATVPHSVLRSRITTVSQDAIEFDESIRFNLCPWTMSKSKEEGNVNEDSVIEMLKELKLWDLAVKKGGLEARLSDLHLSPGQRRLICIARACLHKLQTRSRLVIIDESTSGLDGATEQLALNVMEIAFWDCTVIEVAHRATSLADADLILHMDEGRVAKQELPRAGVPQSPSPPPPPTQPTAPVPMNPFFQGMLNKSLAAEREVRRQIEANPELYGPLPPF